MEIHRICEVTATPLKEGANLSEYSNNKRIELIIGIRGPLFADLFSFHRKAFCGIIKIYYDVGVKSPQL